ncbi:hypothetical protein [Pseudomonas sp. Gutcm_11s]|uniref:hypothetical protein n=1 Tax=Pseudomonas sp. Gutcm_11s TaxID=3026088 RepID=UPI0023609890|nr:hypothetical protein [Pseudomonas sp. Gutcm_11s]MDD0844811.1 hypothetical protein [Pseudomonas sp. Gutcm_11s]
MEAFKFSTHLSDFLSSYPNAENIVKAAANGGEQSKIAIARLWLSEGIPYAFKDNPALYETVRSWLGVRLSVDPKEISLTGSGRIGQSLAPAKIGTGFGEHSDLDLFVVSSDLFEKVVKNFNEWSYDFESGVVNPSNGRERGFWESNIYSVPRNIEKGFIDSKYIPSISKYASAQNIAQTMWLLKSKLDITEKAPRVQSASIRCYRSWGEYVRQVVKSL